MTGDLNGFFLTSIELSKIPHNVNMLNAKVILNIILLRYRTNNVINASGQFEHSSIVGANSLCLRK